MIRDLLISVRPRQWIKNSFVLVAPLFARRLLEPDIARASLAAFVLFTLVACGIYLVNDVSDRGRDRRHPKKRERPIASGRLGVGPALAAAAILLAAGLVPAFLLWPKFAAYLALYVVIQVFYSVKLRHVVLLDVFSIASGFVIRVLAGAAVVDIEVSSWLILTTIFLSLFLAICKRRAELDVLEEGGAAHRQTLSLYDATFLEVLIAVNAASVVLCYSLYTLSDRTVREFGTKNLVFTVPFVIYGTFRYFLLVHLQRGGGSPATTILTDLPLAVNALLWAVTTIAIVY